MEENKPIVRIRNLKKSYGHKQVLKGVNLDIYPGQVIGYIGPNGAGKSTTVKILTGLISDFEGEVEVGTYDVRVDTLAVKSLIGYVPEHAELYDVLTPMEYLDFAGKLYGQDDMLIESRATSLLKAFGLFDVKDDRMESFSKGMRQKVLLASGLIHNPQIIVLDEPLSGLDANAVILVKEMIALLAKEGKTIFYCSHMMDIVEKVSDRIVLIVNGEIVANGTIDELKTGDEKTLEEVFAKLTLGDTEAAKALDIIQAIR